MNFKWENDNFFWERLRLEEIGLPESWNFIIPDKLFHFLMVFYFAIFFYTLMKKFDLGKHRTIACLLSWALWMGPWEIVLDGMFRYGASWKDMIANTLGAIICWWWLGNINIGQGDDDETI